MFHQKQYFRAAIVLLIAFLTVGLSIYKDFGMSWDGPAQRDIGISNLRYVCEQTTICEPDEFLTQKKSLAYIINKDYGPVHEMLLIALEWQLGITDTQKIFELRNLINFLYFFFGVVLFFLFVSDAMNGYQYGILATAILVLSPRLFGHAFFNTKDLAFLASILVALYTMNRLLKSPNAGNAIIHGIATGYSIDIRIMGVVILLCTVSAISIQSIKSREEAKRLAFPTGIFLLTTFCATVAMWPHLWHKPGMNFVESFANMAHFRWTANVKFLGDLIPANKLPWYYAPTWISISTPITYLLLIAAGLGMGIWGLIKNSLNIWTDHEEMMTTVCLVLFVGPIAAVIVLKSILYDGWRQLFFVYPPAVFLATLAAKKIYKKASTVRFGGEIAVALLAIAMFNNLYQTIEAHPFQNSYLNSLAGQDASMRFDNDYWGVSNKQAIEFIDSSDASEQITIAGRNTSPIEHAIMSLKRERRARFQAVEPEAKPLYIVTNYRIDNDRKHMWYKGYHVIHQINVAGNNITTVFKRSDEKGRPKL